MSDISNQLIKDSFNYVLQSDIVTGVVYRIGGSIPVNPIFSSGLTINSGFTYSNGTEQNGYVLTCDASGNASWGPASAITTSALTYYVSATTPTGVTLQSGDRWFNTSSGDELVWVNDGDSSQWIQICCGSGGSPSQLGVGYYLTTGITISQTLTWDKTYWGISGNTNVDLVLPSVAGKDGYYLIIKDEAGICGNHRIRLTPTSGTIDGNNYVDMNINYMSLTCIVRGGNWYLI